LQPIDLLPILLNVDTQLVVIEEKTRKRNFKARWVPLLPRESAKKTFSVGDRSLPQRHALFPGLTLGVRKIPFRVFSSNSAQFLLRFKEKGGKEKELPVHHKLG
jgi:hypothetical protein